MKNKICSVEAAVSCVTDGMNVGLGGVLDRRRPIELCQGLSTKGTSGLHIFSFLAGAETEILAKAITTLTTGYIDPRADTSTTDTYLANGEIRLREVSEHIFVAGLQAAASGLPFWPTLGATGSDVAAKLDLRDVRCPYTGRDLLAVPATPLDIALIHAEAATADGAVLGPDNREFLDDADLLLARAADHVIVSVQRIAEDSEVAGGLRTVIAPFEIGAVVLLNDSRTQ